MSMEQEGTLRFSQAGKGYANQKELLRDWFYLLDYRIYLLYRYHVWLGPENRMQGMLGVVISREEFERKLDACARINGFEAASKEELTELAMIDRLVGGRLEHTTAAHIPSLRLVESCGLDMFDWRCVLLAFSARLDAKYSTLFAYLQDDVTKKAPTFALACQLFARPGFPAAENHVRFAQDNRFSALFERGAWERGELVLLPVVEAFLLGKALPLPDGFRLESAEGEMSLPIRPAFAEQLAQKATGAAIVVLRGAHGIGKRFLAQAVAREQGCDCLLVDLEQRQDTAAQRARTALLLAALLEAVPCLCHLETLSTQQRTAVEDALAQMPQDYPALFLCTEDDYRLFFDECDALFGKRSEVKDAHDRNANVETAYLLQQMEEHEGVTVLATNLLQNMDAAFLRRISFVVSFPFPDQAMRERLFRGMLPAEAPVAPDVDFRFWPNGLSFQAEASKTLWYRRRFRRRHRAVPSAWRKWYPQRSTSCKRMISSSQGRICGNTRIWWTGDPSATENKCKQRQAQHVKLQ